MNALIICTNRNKFPVPVLPSGACMIAEAAERAGHSVRLLDLMFQPDPLRAIKAELGGVAYDVIGLSVRNIDNVEMGGPRYFIDDLTSLVEAVRAETDAPVIMGGTAVTVMPEEILRTTLISRAVIGDGVVVLPRLLERLARHELCNDLAGVASFDDGVFRINPPANGPCDNCAAPDYRRWLNMKAYRSYLSTVPLQTKLGCRFQCVYCTYPKIEGDAYRLIDPGSAAEAAIRFASSGLRDIEFVDNVFNAPYDHAMDVCEALIRARPRARFQSLELNPAVFDHELLSAMEWAGFVGIGLTVESASDPVLRGLKKGFTAREVHAAADVVRGHQLPCLWIFMLGGPGETRETVRETLRFAETAIRPQDTALFNVGVRIYPGTELEAIARKEGLLAVPSAGMLEPVFYVSPAVDAAWIMNEVRNSVGSHMNFMNSDSLSHPYLPRITRMGHWLGVRPPLWRYTRRIRRGLRFVGMEV
ncbi:MAG TPA: radical SAM protein [Nitrospirota bacterium]|nr:radical SAM protein [Nitrospirota bacterium]